jgi:hypothetical protein
LSEDALRSEGRRGYSTHVHVTCNLRSIPGCWNVNIFQRFLEKEHRA